jgi:YVTN family beta-propeller protein
MDDLKPPRLEAKIQVGGAPNAPDWQAIGFGSLWVANASRRSVQRIDVSNKIVAEVALDDAPCSGLAVGADTVWAAGCGVGTVYRIDPKTNKLVARISTPIGDGDGEGLIGADASGLWLFIDANGTLAHINARTNKIDGAVALPAQSFSAVVGGGAVWATSHGSDVVVRVDPKTAKIVATIPAGSGPRFEAYGLGALWVLNQGDGTVTRVNPTTNLTRTIAASASGDGGCIAAGEGSVWVTMPARPVIRIDPATNQVAELFLGAGGDCISAGLGSVWLSNHDFGDVWRIRPSP